MRLRTNCLLSLADPGRLDSHKEHVVLGMSAAVGAFLMFTVMNMFAKLLSVNHSAIEIAFYRNLVACLPFLILIFGFGRREILVIRSKPSLVGIRAAIGTLSLVTTFYAYSPHLDNTASSAATSLLPDCRASPSLPVGLFD